MIQYRPSLPDLGDYYAGLKQIWIKKQLTNNGENVQRLERQLVQELEVPYVSLVSSGTMAIMITCKLFGLWGEVITPALTFPGVIGALKWIGIKPVLCPPRVDCFNLDTDRIESLITENTSAILPVHLFGIPCNIDQIQIIADRYKLPVIYDASHCFGIKINGKGIATFGDITIFSLHATKIFHCVEGGLLACQEDIYQKAINLLRNFGIIYENKVEEDNEGINGKMSELHALMGLCLLNDYKAETEKRKEVYSLYWELLTHLDGIKVPSFGNPNISYNYSYFPIIVEDGGNIRDQLYEGLLQQGIWTKKFFYNNNILLLPLHSGMDTQDIFDVCRKFREILWEINS